MFSSGAAALLVATALCGCVDGDPDAPPDLSDVPAPMPIAEPLDDGETYLEVDSCAGVTVPTPPPDACGRAWVTAPRLAQYQGIACPPVPTHEGVACNQVVLGRHECQQTYVGCDGYVTLNVPDSQFSTGLNAEFTSCVAHGGDDDSHVNASWLSDGVGNRRPLCPTSVLVCTAKDDLPDASAITSPGTQPGEHTTRELCQLRQNGCGVGLHNQLLGSVHCHAHTSPRVRSPSCSVNVGGQLYRAEAIFQRTGPQAPTAYYLASYRAWGPGSFETTAIVQQGGAWVPYAIESRDNLAGNQLHTFGPPHGVGHIGRVENVEFGEFDGFIYVTARFEVGSTEAECLIEVHPPPGEIPSGTLCTDKVQTGYGVLQYCTRTKSAGAQHQVGWWSVNNQRFNPDLNMSWRGRCGPPGPFGWSWGLATGYGCAEIYQQKNSATNPTHLRIGWWNHTAQSWHPFTDWWPLAP